MNPLDSHQLDQKSWSFLDIIGQQRAGLPARGTTTNDDAIAGNIGEYKESIVAIGSHVSLTTATTANVTSLSLTSGDWDVEGLVSFDGGGTTNVTRFVGGSSSVSATLGSQGAHFVMFYGSSGIVPFAEQPSWPIPVLRYSLGTTTTIFLVVQCTFTVSTAFAFGVIRARRIR